MSDELDENVVAVESILLRMQEVNETKDYHLLQIQCICSHNAVMMETIAYKH